MRRANRETEALKAKTRIGEAIWDSQDPRGLTDCPQICADLRILQNNTPSENLVNLRNLRIQKKGIPFHPGICG